MKAIKVEFNSYAHYLVSVEDAALLLAIALRSRHVERTNHGEPYRQVLDYRPFMHGIEIVDYEPLALPQEEQPF